IPPPRRAMHTPSNAWRRSFSPSRTRTITRTVSPAWKAGMFVLSPSRSIARSLCIHAPSSFSVARPQIGPPFARQAFVLRHSPCRNLVVIAAQQYVRYVQAAIARRPRVAGRRQQAVVVRIARRRLVIPERTREQSHHRIYHTQRRRLAARQHEITDRCFFRSKDIHHSLIDVLVVPT